MKWVVTIMLIIPIFPTISFSETDTYVCNYITYCNESGLHEDKKSFKLIFVVDRSNNNAYMVGNMGSTEVSLVPSIAGGITFVEVTPGGNVMTTTISSNGKSVHSRNSIIDGELVPSQRYGICIYK